MNGTSTLYNKDLIGDCYRNSSGSARDNPHWTHGCGYIETKKLEISLNDYHKTSNQDEEICVVDRL